MRALKANDVFRFCETINAIHLTNPFGGHSMGYHAPSDEAKGLYKPELLGDEITIPNTDTLTVTRAYASISGWCVSAVWNGYEIFFHQAQVEGLRSVSKLTTTLQVAEIFEQ